VQLNFIQSCFPPVLTAGGYLSVASRLWRPYVPGGRGILPSLGYIGTCAALKGMFFAVLVRPRVLIFDFSQFGLKLAMVFALWPSIGVTMFFRRSYFFHH